MPCQLIARSVLRIPLQAALRPTELELTAVAGACRLASFKLHVRHIHNERDSTIYAPATPAGKSAIAVVRISGPAVEQVWKSKIREARKSSSIDDLVSWPPSPRKALLRQICNAQTGEKLDEGIVIYFPGQSTCMNRRKLLTKFPAAKSSLTGQDTLELHLHGSNAVLKAVLTSLASLKSDHNVDIRPAEPGEFTRLAFDSGRMDLTEVEGLRDLIDAETEVQRKLASQLAGVSARTLLRGYAYQSTRRAWQRKLLKRCERTSSVQCLSWKL